MLFKGRSIAVTMLVAGTVASVTTISLGATAHSPAPVHYQADTGWDDPHPAPGGSHDSAGNDLGTYDTGWN